MNDIFEELNLLPSDDLTVTNPRTEKRRMRGLDNSKDGLEIWNECKRDAITNIYKSDPYVRAEIDAVYGEHSIQSNSNDMSFLSKPNPKPKPVDVMRDIKREIHAKYSIKE